LLEPSLVAMIQLGTVAQQVGGAITTSSVELSMESLSHRRTP
jgi:hypothetical protein